MTVSETGSTYRDFPVPAITGADPVRLPRLFREAPDDYKPSKALTGQINSVSH